MTNRPSTQRRLTMSIIGMLALSALSAAVLAQSPQAPPVRGTVEVFQLRSPALEGNLIGDSPVRDVSVYLPPGYSSNAERRYPVVYFLHGFTDSDATWFGRVEEHWINLPQVLNRAFAAPAAVDTIVVMPNAFNAFQGSFYSSSVTIGDWETFVAEELVAEIDSRFRTLAVAASRGLSGHSMGGYGAVRIGMKRPDVFSSVYALSSCCLTPLGATGGGRSAPAEAITAVEQVSEAGFGIKAALATAAAWSPNPGRPPLFLDLPTEDGEPQPEVIARFAANAPVALVPQYVFNLRRLTGFAFDVGTSDGLRGDNAALDRVLTAYQVPHVFETYDGNHVNGVAERIETKVMPFFGRQLAR